MTCHELCAISGGSSIAAFRMLLGASPTHLFPNSGSLWGSNLFSTPDRQAGSRGVSPVNSVARGPLVRPAPARVARGPWVVLGLSLGFPWGFLGCSLGFPWVVLGFSLGFPWVVLGFSLGCPWVFL